MDNGRQGNETRDVMLVNKEDPDPDLMRSSIADKPGAAAARTGLVRRELSARLQASYRTEWLDVTGFDVRLSFLGGP